MKRKNVRQDFINSMIKCTKSCHRYNRPQKICQITQVTVKLVFLIMNTLVKGGYNLAVGMFQKSTQVPNL